MQLFSPMRLGALRLPNRLALNAVASGHTVPEGIFTRTLASYYQQRARLVGLVVIEPTYVLPPPDHMTAHVGLYADAQLFALASCIGAMHRAGAAVLVMLDQPLWLAGATMADLMAISDAFLVAAQRARTAGADGVMFSAADGGPIEQLVSPLQNQRSDAYGGDLRGRLRLLTELIELIARKAGPQFVLGVRLNVDEFTPGGIDMQEARLISTMLAGAGAGLIEIGSSKPQHALVAQFPGWQLPLAAALKAVVDVPVMVGGLLDDPALADSAIRDKCADLVAVGERLRADPAWPLAARAALQ